MYLLVRFVFSSFVWVVISCFFFSSRRRHTRFKCDWSSDVCSSDLPQAAAANFTDFWRNASWDFHTVRLVGVAMVGALFSADAWNNVTFTGAEVRNPRRNIPLALGLGVAIVSALYIATNYVYLNVLPLAA